MNFPVNILIAINELASYVNKFFACFVIYICVRKYSDHVLTSWQYRNYCKVFQHMIICYILSIRVWYLNPLFLISQPAAFVSMGCTKCTKCTKNAFPVNPVNYYILLDWKLLDQYIFFLDCILCTRFWLLRSNWKRHLRLELAVSLRC